jgi:hypothetical protein
MVARDLPHQRQSQSGACAVAGVLGAIKGPEHVFKLGWRYALTTVPYRDDGDAGIACDPHPRGRCSMASGVLQKVAQQSTQQARIAMDADHCALELHVIVARAFFGGERQQIDFFRCHRNPDNTPATSTWKACACGKDLRQRADRQSPSVRPFQMTKENLIGRQELTKSDAAIEQKDD